MATEEELEAAPHFISRWVNNRSFYSVVFFLEDLQAIRFNPLQVENDRIYISQGLMKHIEIKWTEIDVVIEDRAIFEKNRTKNTIEYIARDFEKTYPDVIIKLKQPKEATLLMGMKLNYEQVAIRVDDAERFKQLLKKKLQNEFE